MSTHCKAYVIPLIKEKLDYCVGWTSIVEAIALHKKIISTHNPYYPIDIEEEGIGYYTTPSDEASWSDIIGNGNFDYDESTLHERFEALADKYNIKNYAEEVYHVIKRIGLTRIFRVMSDKTLLAIVIPAYKSKFLELALNSICKQTDKRFHLYIGDDNSPEHLYDIILKYEDKITLTYKRFDENLGRNDLIAHWERCIDLVQDEEYIWFFSDDDMMEKNVRIRFLP